MDMLIWGDCANAVNLGAVGSLSPLGRGEKTVAAAETHITSC
jgi:hypothetical protein